MIDTTNVESKLMEAEILDKEEDARDEAQESYDKEEEVEEKAEEAAEVSYKERVDCCENEEAKEGLSTLFEYGFTDFDANLAMLRSVNYSVNMAVNGLIDSQ